jgi:hypothetical protein
MINKKYFPIDFNGADEVWRFTIRVSKEDNLIEAMYWAAYLSLHRGEYDLLSIACGYFKYEREFQMEAKSVAQDKQFYVYPVRTKAKGPIVPIERLLELINRKNNESIKFAS